MVVVRRSLVRTASVPVGHDDPDTLPDSVYEAHRTRMISNAALDNSDSLSAASRRHDQQLMKEINDRLANSTLSRPSPTLKRRSSVQQYNTPITKPPLPTSSVSVVTSLKSNDVDNDVDRDVDLMMPATSRALRSGSVPPSSSSSSVAAIMAEFSVPTVPIVRTKIIRDGSPVVQLNGSTRYGSYYGAPESVSSRYAVKSPAVPNGYYSQTTGSLTPSADFAVRQAQRDLDRIDQELKTDSTFTPRASPVRTVRSYVTSDTRPILRRSSSYHGPSSGTRVRSPSPSYSSLVSPSYSTLVSPSYSTLVSSSLPYQYSYGTDPSYHTTTRTYTTTPRTDVATLRKITTDDLGYTPSTTRVHVPALTYPSTYVSPSSTHLTGDIEALIRSAKTLPEVSTTKTVYVKPSSVHVTSYNPSSSTSSTSMTNGLPPIPRPQVSQTRRHVREVLCKVKKDPHYYD